MYILSSLTNKTMFYCFGAAHILLDNCRAYKNADFLSFPRGKNFSSCNNIIAYMPIRIQ